MNSDQFSFHYFTYYSYSPHPYSHLFNIKLIRRNKKLAVRVAMYILTLKIRVLRFIKKLSLALSLIEKHTHVHTYIECVEPSNAATKRKGNKRKTHSKKCQKCNNI